jgi:hypothetical protein
MFFQKGLFQRFIAAAASSSGNEMIVQDTFLKAY